MARSLYQLLPLSNQEIWGDIGKGITAELLFEVEQMTLSVVCRFVML